MRFIKHILISIIFLSIAFISCQKETPSPSEGEPIYFQVSSPDISVTKGEITEFNPSNAKIFVYGIKNNQSLFGTSQKNGTDKYYNIPSTITPSNGNIWKLKKSFNAKDTEIQEWNTTAKTPEAYTFHAYAYNNLTFNATDGPYIYPDANFPEQDNVREGYGTYVNLIQPKSEFNNTIDYMLSYVYSTNDDANTTKPLIKLEFEHAMTKVSLDLIRCSKIRIQKIEFSGIMNHAEMTCTTRKKSGETGVDINEWTYQYKGSTATYTYGPEPEAVQPSEDPYQNPQHIMSFMAIPTDKNHMTNYKLTVTYIVGNDKDHPFTRVFNLGEKEAWVHGHHIKYQLVIDHNVHLTGSIENWVEVDFIEGTILPSIPKN